MKIRLKWISEYTIIKDKIQNGKICLKYMWPLLINRFPKIKGQRFNCTSSISSSSVQYNLIL